MHSIFFVKGSIMQRLAQYVFCCTIVAMICIGSPCALAQDAEDQKDQKDQDAGTAAPETPPVQDFQGGDVERGFKLLPTEKNTYNVTFDLRGLLCVKDVGTPTQCGVPNQSADEGGYPWTKVKCRKGDRSVSTFAWSLDQNRPMGIFEAPPALVTGAQTYTVNVRLGRVCQKPNGGGK